MNYIENIYICLGAPLFLAILCLRRDAKRHLIFLFAGMTACLLSAYVSTYITGATGTDVATASHEISPAVEESLKCLPLVFYLLVFSPEKRETVSGALLVAVGFATFENVCFLTSYGTSDLLSLLIRGFGTGAMHVVCGMVISTGLAFLWDQAWLRIAGAFALLCFSTTIHAVFNVLTAQSGPSFRVGSAIPLILVLVYLLFFRRKTEFR